MLEREATVSALRFARCRALFCCFFFSRPVVLLADDRLAKVKTWKEIKKKVKGIKLRILVLTFQFVHGSRECVACGSASANAHRPLGSIPPSQSWLPVATKATSTVTDFFPAWDEKYPTLESTERKELEEEEESYQAEIDSVKKTNAEEVAKRGRRKAAIQPHPATSERLNELRARAADRGTKQQSRKVEPFRAWLASIKAVKGAPRRVQLPWVLWQDASHGEALRARYREAYKKEADDEEEEGSLLDPFEKDGDEGEDGAGPTPAQLLSPKAPPRPDEEQERVREKREEEYAARLAAHNRLMQGNAACTAEELAERRRHAEAISQRALDSMCSQMQCKGVVLLGEIVDGDSDEIFLSMVQQGAMPRRPGVDFTTWAPVRSKAVLQAFADFLVACKKEEKGVLGPLTDPGPPAPHTPALCTRRRLPPLLPPGTAAPVVSGAIAEKTSQQKAGKKAGKKAKRRRGEEEPEAEESGAEDDEGEWPGGGGSDDELEQDPFANEEEEGGGGGGSAAEAPAGMALQNSLAAMAMPERNHRIHTLNALSDAEYDRENNVARNKDLFRRLFPVDPVVELGLRAPPSNEPPPSSKPPPSSEPPPSNEPPPQPTRSSQHLANATGQAQVADPGSDGVMLIDAPMAASSAEDEPTRPSQRLASAAGQAQAVDSGSGGVMPASSAEDEGAPASAHGAASAMTEAQAPAGRAAGGMDVPGPRAGLACADVARADVSSSEKHAKVLAHFQSGINLPAWGAVVDAWCALERATGLQVPGKALPAYGRPEAVSWWVQRARNDRRIPAGLEEEDQRDAFYDKTVNWWIAVNPAWRKEGVTGPASFVERGLKQESGGDLEGLPAGLNGLTSLAGVVEGAPRWKKLADDVTWVLTEKSRAFGHKRAVAPSGDEPAGKRARLG
ncbi:hypothetical protein B0H14DRAFT_2656893 [Mycena olivaceomarginata]|nr:hypothetical protein B0H14DRAFT_2656893 [Mycena olivaceomarginata]